MRWRLVLLIVVCGLAGSCLPKRQKLPPLCGPEQFPDMHRCRVWAEGER